MLEKNVLRVLLKKNPYLLEFIVGDDDMLVSKDVLKSKDFLNLEHSSKLLVKIGRNLWSGEEQVSLYEIFNNLDHENYQNFVTALAMLNTARK